MSLQHLTDDQRKEVSLRLGSSTITGQFIPWPDWAPKQYNACTDACDMWTGPCACGAWHRDGR